MFINLFLISEPKIYIEAVESEHYDDDLPDCKTFEQQKKIVSIDCFCWSYASQSHATPRQFNYIVP